MTRTTARCARSYPYIQQALEHQEQPHDDQSQHHRRREHEEADGECVVLSDFLLLAGLRGGGALGVDVADQVEPLLQAPLPAEAVSQRSKT